MPTANPNVPSDMGVTIVLLNASGSWNLTLVEQQNRFYLYDGDQVQFVANTEGEAEAFLAGCFLTQYQGKDLAAILADLAGKGLPGMTHDQVVQEITKQRQDRYLRRPAEGG